MKVKKTIHKIYTEVAEARKKGIDIKPVMGKWHYIYSSNKGEISLIQLKNYWKQGVDLWEIWELSANNLFDDVERYKTKKEAIKRIKKLLD